LLQPLWIEDLVTCLVWALEDNQTRNQTYSIGGPEFLSFTQILTMIMDRTRTPRKLLHISPPYLRFLTILLETLLPALPISVYWLDYLAANRTCSLDTIPRTFNLLPSRFSHRLEYLQNQDWRSSFYRTVFRRQPR
jgi:NADH dehydrogenase